MRTLCASLWLLYCVVHVAMITMMSARIVGRRIRMTTVHASQCMSASSENPKWAEYGRTAMQNGMSVLFSPERENLTDKYRKRAGAVDRTEQPKMGSM